MSKNTRTPAYQLVVVRAEGHALMRRGQRRQLFLLYRRSCNIDRQPGTLRLNSSGRRVTRAPVAGSRAGVDP